MTSPRHGQLTWRRPRIRRLACTLAAVTTPLALAVPAAAHVAASTSPAAASSALTAMHPAAPVTVTLITGDVIQMTRGPAGRTSVTSQPALRADGARPMIEVTSSSRRGRTPTIYALPADASALIAAGRVDKNLFNVGYLAATENATTTRNTVPVVIQYGGRLSAGELAARAGHLPGASVRAVLPASNTAEVNLSTRDAARFWAALTGGHTALIRAAPRPGAPAPQPALARGVTRIWLAGHHSPSQPSQPAGTPTYPVTVTIYGHANPGPADRWCLPDTETVCPGTSDYLLGVAGSGADSQYGNLGSWSCLDQNPCDTIQEVTEVPVGVYSLGGGFGSWTSDGRLNQYDLADPQFVVAGPTQIAFHLDDAVPLKVSTPHPAQTAQNGITAERDLPDGTSVSDIGFGNYGEADEFWTVPTTQPVTIGTWNLQTTFDLIQPPVTMTATRPDHLTLDPFYPSYSSHGWISDVNAGSQESAIRFSGQQTLPLVDVGAGSAADFAGRHVHGKLVLMRLTFAHAIVSCTVTSEQLQNALHAGAAGVLVDPTYPPSRGFPAYGCPLPTLPAWWFDGELGLKLPVLQIPYVSIPPSQATALRRLMSHHGVSITVTDNGQAHYAYHLNFQQNGQVPASPARCCTSQQLATVTANYHADSPQPWGVGDSSVFSAFASDDHTVGGVQDSLGAPLSRQEYMLAAPDMTQWLNPDGAPDPAANGAFTTASEFHVFGKRDGSETWNWFAAPDALGARLPPEDVFQAMPGVFNAPFYSDFCAACRQGNVFWPYFDVIPGAAPGQIGGINGVSHIHLYSGGQEIPLVNGTYQLPSAQASYRLTVTDLNTQNTWHFTSAAPASNQVPDGATCLGRFTGSTDPCQPVPLVFLRYDAGLSLTNTVPAPGAHKIQITAYHADPNAPAITSMKVWVSYDGGTTWQPANAVHPDGRGQYTAIYTVPDLSATSGNVSLRVQAQDAGGNNVTQVIKDAFKLSAK